VRARGRKNCGHHCKNIIRFDRADFAYPKSLDTAGKEVSARFHQNRPYAGKITKYLAFSRNSLARRAQMTSY